MSAVWVRPDYGWPHQQTRANWSQLVLAGGVKCARCLELIRPGEPWDLGHVDGDPSRYSGPEHRRCNRQTSGRRPWMPPPELVEVERDGLPASDERWDVPWLRGLRRVPRDATWPRLMSVPHPQAVGSLGGEFCRWAQERTGRKLRWWQRLVATRLLEVDQAGELVWETLVMSTARQLGKSWLLRELMLWRIHQAGRFGEPQDVMHTGKDIAICKEVQRPARFWAKSQPDLYRVREVNGQENIENLVDGSRWMLRAKEAVYGYSVSCAVADEAWKVKPETIEEALTPTMVERLQPQLLLVSTAHRLATPLMIVRRKVALEDLEVGDGDLLIEWSAPRGVELNDVDGWRLASPHWTPRRERLIRKRLEGAYAGERDPDEPDPIESFRAQWLNQWPDKAARHPDVVEDLLPSGLWQHLTEPGLVSSGPIFVGLEDDFGLGAAVAAVCRLDDGRLEVDGWLCDDWDSAMLDLQRLAALRQISEVHVGASLVDRLPQGAGLPRARPAAQPQARAGLAVFRDLASNFRLVHDENTGDLDLGIESAKVRELGEGLHLVAGPKHLVKAVVWAVAAAHRPARVPTIR